ncbi:MAG: hypothetical protein AABX83_00900 [Nanoarchaeota archaeon]
MENRIIENLFNRESCLDQKRLSDESRLGLGLQINPVDNPSYFYLILLKHEKRIEYGPKFEDKKQAYDAYQSISSTADFRRCKESR